MTKRVLLPAVMVLLAACGGGDGDKIDFERVTTEKVVKLTNEEQSPQCSVHLDIAQAADSNGERAKKINDFIESKIFNLEQLTLKEAADSFANQYTRDYVTHYRPLYNEDKADSIKRSWYEYHYIVTTETQPGRKGVANYLITLDYYEGGAHGINQLLTINFDTHTGQAYTLADVFEQGYQRRLNEILLKALMEKTESEDLDALHDKGYLYSMSMFASENFILGPDAITFVYNPYEIAPYAFGKTELKIAYKALDDILKK